MSIQGGVGLSQAASESGLMQLLAGLIDGRKHTALLYNIWRAVISGGIAALHLSPWPLCGHRRPPRAESALSLAATASTGYSAC